MPNENIGDISNLISKSPSKPKNTPSRIEVLEGRVTRLETALKTVVKEVTALRAEVRQLQSPKEPPPPKGDGKPQRSAIGPKLGKFCKTRRSSAIADKRTSHKVEKETFL